MSKFKFFLLFLSQQVSLKSGPDTEFFFASNAQVGLTIAGMKNIAGDMKDDERPSKRVAQYGI